MSRKKDEKRLDEIISRTINSGKPEFDAEKWKQKFPEEFQMLKSMSAEKAHTRRLSIWRKVCQSPITKLAAAAVIIAGIGLHAFIVHQCPDERPVTKIAKSPVEMMTAMSLERAFQRGGIEAVEDQCRKAFRPIGLRPASLSFEQIIAEFNDNNKSSEGTRP
jgi:hypothetical protein